MDTARGIEGFARPSTDRARVRSTAVESPVDGRVAGEDLHVIARLREGDALGEELSVAELGEAPPPGGTRRARVVGDERERQVPIPAAQLRGQEARPQMHVDLGIEEELAVPSPDPRPG